MLVDTHSHIYSEEYIGETDEVISRALEAGVYKILLPNVDSSSVKRMLDLSDRYPDVCYPMMGIHPTSVKEDFQSELDLFDFWITRREFVGIGEIGIDLFWDKKWFDEQVIVFRHQLKVAREMNLPVAIHTRDSFPETISIVREMADGRLTGVFHAFSGNSEQAREVLDLGFKIGVGGVVTFKNSGTDQVISSLTLKDIVLETDAPWLSPVPFRGKRNESAFLTLIQKKVASIFHCKEEEVARITTETARQLFPFS